MSSSGRQGAAKLRVAARPESESLQKVKRGEMTLEEYLDERAEKALAHVKGKVADDILDGVRQTLREKLRTDPVLVEAVRRATGRVPGPLSRAGR
jgi:hypothetical protein